VNERITTRKPQPAPEATFAGARGYLLQCQCACGCTPELNGGCEVCRRKSLTSGRSLAQPPTGVETHAQPKVRVTVPGDAREQESDRIADQVMRTADAGAATNPSAQRAEAIPEEGAEVLANVARAISGLRGKGAPMDASTRTFIEGRFGHEFGRVRVQTDGKAANLARRVNAVAFTTGQDVVFGSGQYSPGTRRGKFLIAHELSHVLQQSSATTVPPEQIRVGCPDTMHEREANRIAKIVTSGPRGRMVTPAFSVSALQLQRVGFGEVRVAEARLEEEERLRLTAGCKNQSQVVDRMRATSRKYSGAVTMYTHQISKGDTLSGLAQTTMADNTVHVFGHYFDEIKNLNNGIDAGTIGNCVLLLRGWTDPAIGVLPEKPTGALPADVQRAIAAIYVEQTNTTTQAQLQQKYIWYSIRIRLALGLHGPTIDDVLDKGGYWGKGTALYTTALADIALPEPTMGAVGNIRSIVLGDWDTAIPADAGPFYFHWQAGKTAEPCFTKKGDEKACAWEYANATGIAGSVAKADGWHHKIPGDTPVPKDRIGPMYIYK
jgi:hypothetical protein